MVEMAQWHYCILSSPNLSVHYKPKLPEILYSYSLFVHVWNAHSGLDCGKTPEKGFKFPGHQK